MCDLLSKQMNRESFNEKCDLTLEDKTYAINFNLKKYKSATVHG